MVIIIMLFLTIASLNIYCYIFSNTSPMFLIFSLDLNRLLKNLLTTPLKTFTQIIRMSTLLLSPTLATYDISQPKKDLAMTSSFENIFGLSFSLSKLRVFGCLCYPWFYPYTSQNLNSSSPHVSLGTHLHIMHIFIMMSHCLKFMSLVMFVLLILNFPSTHCLCPHLVCFLLCCLWFPLHPMFVPSQLVLVLPVVVFLPRSPCQFSRFCRLPCSVIFANNNHSTVPNLQLTVP